MLFASLVVRGYASAYPDVRFDDYIRPAARTVVRRVVDRCLSEPATLLSLPAVLTGESLFARDLTTGPLARRLRENVPARATRTPLLLAQGRTDTLVLPAVQRRFAARLCDLGQPLQFREVPGRDHVGVVAEGSPLVAPLLAWTADRLDGRPARTRCPS